MSTEPDSKPPEIVPQTRPALIFDGDCEFCRYWIDLWRDGSGEAVEFVPSSEAASRFPQVSPEAMKQAVQWVGTDGETCAGAEAVFRALATAPRRGIGLALYRRVPGFAPATEAAYAAVAANRNFFSSLTRLTLGPKPIRSEYRLSAWFFQRALAAVYFIAFVSLGVQVLGLIGSDGILSAEPYLLRERAALDDPSKALRTLPTIFLYGASDSALQGACWAGAGVSALAALGFLSGPLLIIAWALYLSLVVVGQVFMNYQWDALLLEAGFLAIFLSPWKVWTLPSREPRPSRLMIFLLRWLLFRLMFASGWAKLDADEIWRNLTALAYHYETQPLPTGIAWWMHQAPLWFHKLSALGMFVIELVVPFFIFAPRRIRHAAAVVLIFFQLVIMATGNYGFFNLLTIALCIPVFDDTLLRRVFGRFVKGEGASRTVAPWLGVPVSIVRFGVAAALFLITATQTWMMVRPEAVPSGPAVSLYRNVAPLRITNGYGLFANMTTERPELVIEVSIDGDTWHPYKFKWKPGDPEKRPGFIFGHMPRLDWQMWFEALNFDRRWKVATRAGRRTGPYVDLDRVGWFGPLVLALVDPTPEVTRLFAEIPPSGILDSGQPFIIRVVAWDYEFSDVESRAGTGRWWRRRPLAIYVKEMQITRATMRGLTGPQRKELRRRLAEFADKADRLPDPESDPIQP